MSNKKKCKESEKSGINFKKPTISIRRFKKFI